MAPVPEVAVQCSGSRIDAVVPERCQVRCPSVSDEPDRHTAGRLALVDTFQQDDRWMLHTLHTHLWFSARPSLKRGDLGSFSKNHLKTLSFGMSC